ncbi:hypothetical protein BpHYR1_007205 [Brachionus plicatilis]|uniref:Uncharacterized protein n=1 Tax=Brachionus plicatilis TaxID=10195 RepID=A0A3M7SQI0_BRAPC|nr:hypothetical protein BpHYR1_007205 [Brachionus plicatilis]
MNKWPLLASTNNNEIGEKKRKSSILNNMSLKQNINQISFEHLIMIMNFKLPKYFCYNTTLGVVRAYLKLIDFRNNRMRKKFKKSTPSQVSKKTRGRPPLPRDENGKIIRNN